MVMVDLGEACVVHIVPDCKRFFCRRKGRKNYSQIRPISLLSFNIMPSVINDTAIDSGAQRLFGALYFSVAPVGIEDALA
ncbi:MAG: hypothetical protein P8Z41_07875, partial [Anaerolineales bacterium]